MTTTPPSSLSPARRKRLPVAASLPLLSLLLTLPGLNACIPLVITAVTATAVDVAVDRRTPGRYWDDNALEVKLRRAFGGESELAGVNISVTAVNGIVLLTGEVNSDAQRQRAGEVAESYKATDEAKDIVNELELAGKTTVASRFNDSWITTKVKTRMLQTENLPASAVKVVTEHGKVYLLGQVTQTEAEAAVEAVRTVGGVTHIVKVFEYLD